MRRIYLNVYLVVGITVTVVALGYLLDSSFINRIREFIGEDVLLTFVLSLALYALKPFIPIVPMPIMYFALGVVLESGFVAFFTSIMGLFVAHTFAYLMGRNRVGFVARVISQTAFVRRLFMVLVQRPFFYTVVIRLSPIIPLDSVSALCGAYRIKYSRYILASVIGCLPSVFTVTVTGAVLDNGLSIPLFISIFLMISSFMISLAVFIKTFSEMKRQTKA